MKLTSFSAKSLIRYLYTPLHYKPRPFRPHICKNGRMRILPIKHPLFETDNREKRLHHYCFNESLLPFLSDIQLPVGGHSLFLPALPRYRYQHIHQQKEQVPQFAGEQPGGGGIQAVAGRKPPV